ncbi:MAG: hypothetical protein HYX68_19120 [Planctomycetes bacterium]|nr:hypothetical protein [Planctomycetota bacterium]
MASKRIRWAPSKFSRVIGVGFVLAIAAASLSAQPKKNGIANKNAGATLSRPPIANHSLLLHADNLIGTNSIRFLADSRTLVTTGPFGTVRYWDWRTGQTVKAFRGHLFVAVSPDGKYLASKDGYSSTVLKIWDCDAKKEIARLDVPYGLMAFRFSPCGKFLAISGGTANNKFDDPPLRLHEIATGKVVQTFPLRWTLRALVFTPDGKRIITTHDYAQTRFLQVWDVETGKELRHLEGAFFTSSQEYLQTSPDGNLLVGVSPGIRVWDLQTGKEKWFNRTGDPPNLCVDGITACDFSPNGHMILVGAYRGPRAKLRGAKASVYLFETATGKIRARFDGGENVRSAAFSPCGRLCGTINLHWGVNIWDPTDLVRHAGKPAPDLVTETLNDQWHALASQVGEVSWKAVTTLAVRPEQTATLFKKRLRVNVTLDQKMVDKLVSEFDSTDFNVCEKAMNHLIDMGREVEPVLQKVRSNALSPRAKNCLAELLDPSASGRIAVEELRHLRALETLEYIGNPKAIGLLKTIAGGAPGGQRTRDAKAALGRVLKRVPPSTR